MTPDKAPDSTLPESLSPIDSFPPSNDGAVQNIGEEAQRASLNILGAVNTENSRPGHEDACAYSADEEKRIALSQQLQHIIKQGRIEELKELLKGNNIDGLNLQGVQLTGYDLRGIDFSKTDLQDADLSKSDLREAKLPSTLKNVNLQGACLQGVAFHNVTLGNVDASGADLRGTKFLAARLSEVNFSGANLQDAELRGCYLEKINFQYADMRGATVTKNTYPEVDFTGVQWGKNGSGYPEDDYSY